MLLLGPVLVITYIVILLGGGINDYQQGKTKSGLFKLVLFFSFLIIGLVSYQTEDVSDNTGLFFNAWIFATHFGMAPFIILNLPFIFVGR